MVFVLGYVVIGVLTGFLLARHLDCSPDNEEDVGVVAAAALIWPAALVIGGFFGLGWLLAKAAEASR